MIVVFDVSNHFHSLWHARQGDRVTEQFLRRVASAKETWKPDSLVCAFDSSPSFRKALDPTYKANRQPAPPELLEELDQLAEKLVDQGLASPARCEGFEADDVLATIAAYAVSIDDKCLLCTSDKDCRQCLVEGHVTLAKEFRINQGKIEPVFVTAAKHTQEKGVPPSAWVDWQCLVGDTTDGITGAEGIGEKTATAILQQVGTLEAALADPWKVNVRPKQRDSLFAFRSRADLVRRLVTCRTDVPYVLDAL